MLRNDSPLLSREAAKANPEENNPEEKGYINITTPHVKGAQKDCSIYSQTMAGAQPLENK